MTPTIPQHQYINNWHNSFVNYICSLFGLVAGLMSRPEATEEDKRALAEINLILNGQDVADVEQDLAAGVVKKSTLDKIEKLNKDLTDTCFEHIQMNPLAREFWKQVAHLKIACDKGSEQERLNVLKIHVLDE